MKNSKFLMRFLCLLTVLCMVCAAFASCSADTEEGADTTEPGSETSSTPALDEDGYLLDGIPDDFKIDDSFSILGWGEQKSQFYVEDITEDVVKNSIYARNDTVEDRLNVEIQWKFVNGNWSNRDGFTQHVSATSSAGIAYDALICYNLVPYVLAVNGLAENLYDTEYIDLTGPWWPSAYLNEALYNDTVYGLVESCAYGTLRQMTGVFFNNDLIDAKDLTSPYDMVANNTWTFDNMMAMLKDTHEDRNDNGKKDAGDFYGISTGTTAKIDSWFFGMGYRWSDFDGEGNLRLLAGDSSITEYAERLATAFETSDFCPVDFDTVGHFKLFTQEQSIMYMTSLVLADSHLKKLEIDYGVVPLPKGSDSQERYYTHLSNTHDAWCVPGEVDDIDISSAVIECMASESYRKVDPVYYENCIKLRYAPDERLAAMYDLIRDSITFDFFYLFAASFTTPPLTPLRNCCLYPNQYSWSSTWGANDTVWESEFDSIVALYGGIVTQ